MKWIIHYDIVAFAMIAVVLVVYLTYNHLNTLSNRVYKRLLIVSLCSVVTDIASAYACSFCTENQIVLNYVVNILHFLVQNFVPCLYCLFAYSLVYENINIGSKWFAIIFLPYILNVILILSTPFTGACFYVDSAGIYHRGLGQIFVYIVAGYYIIISCAIVLKNMKLLGVAQRISVLLYSSECIILNIVQIIFSQYLLQEIGIAFAMFFIYISMQNPLEYMDVQIGIYNRNLFKKNINNRIHKKEDFGIICLQIDGLSYINEKFGLNNGNILLKQVASYLGKFTKNNEVYRISNRQLAIVYLKKPDFNILCNEIMSRFEKPFSFSNRNVNVNLWAYLCCIQSSKDIVSANDAFDIIDYSLNEARQTKKNSIVFASTDILEKRRREQEITLAISNAITNSSFQVYYQPIYSLTEKRYTKMEALVRLIDEHIGFIPPDEFIPIAEKNGDILAVGEIVLEKVCSFIEQYHPEDFGINVIHVNLSVVQCMQENINIRLLKIIDKYRIPHGLIDFEITESTADNISENLDKLMNEFEKKGIHFSLDDFGTGYSNQSNLMKHPYKIVKIDKSLLWACDNNPKALISLKHTIAMIKDLDMKVLTEGVENKEQVELLSKIGCEFLQGYYYSRPLPISELMDVIKKNIIKGEL